MHCTLMLQLTVCSPQVEGGRRCEVPRSSVALVPAVRSQCAVQLLSEPVPVSWQGLVWPDCWGRTWPGLTLHFTLYRQRQESVVIELCFAPQTEYHHLTPHTSHYIYRSHV